MIAEWLFAFIILCQLVVIVKFNNRQYIQLRATLIQERQNSIAILDRLLACLEKPIIAHNQRLTEDFIKDTMEDFHFGVRTDAKEAAIEAQRFGEA